MNDDQIEKVVREIQDHLREIGVDRFRVSLSRAALIRIVAEVLKKDD